MARPWIYVAVWHHRHGEDIFLSKTENGRLKACIKGAILPYLSELPKLEDQETIKALCKKRKYSEALRLWGEAKDGEEYIEFYGTALND